jgi:hypothetical protein
MIKKEYVNAVLFGFGMFGCDSAEPLATPELGLAEVLISQCPQSSSLRPRFLSRQGRSLEGLVGESFTVQEARLGCDAVEGLQLQKTSLQGTAAARPVSGADFVGAALLVRDAQGVTSELAVTKLETDATDTTGETQLYTLVALDGSGAAVHNVCNPDAEGRAAAIPLRGRWDQSGNAIADGSISFHCTSGAIAKCVRWGYRPWQSHAGQLLDRHHQACTRMARADYCGDGQSQTQEGTKIDMYDSLGLHTAEPFLLGLFEANWSTGGAYCVARERWLSVVGLLSAGCRGQFHLAIQPSPVRSVDLCFMGRNGSAPQDALLGNRSLLQLSL